MWYGIHRLAFHRSCEPRSCGAVWWRFEQREIAKSKNVYADLQIVNLKKPLPYDAESFDSITCHGVFIQAHCGSETLPYLTHILKKEGIIVTTICWAFYESTKQDWEREIRECGCEVIEQLDVSYLRDMTAMLLVLRKL